MPLPIQPLHHDENITHNLITEEQMDRNLSAIQEAFLGTQSPDKRQANRKIIHPEHMLVMLDQIHKAEDQTLTEATRLARDANGEPVYTAPKNISDYDLLALKAQSLITGHGRAVRFTSAGQTALRDFWFKKDNALLNDRTKTRFMHPWSQDYIRENNDPLPGREASVKPKFSRRSGNK